MRPYAVGFGVVFDAVTVVADAGTPALGGAGNGVTDAAAGGGDAIADAIDHAACNAAGCTSHRGDGAVDVRLDEVHGVGKSGWQNVLIKIRC